jgi:hypothetical protein
MKRASDTSVMFVSVAAAVVVLLVGAFTATAMLRTPADAAPTAAASVTSAPAAAPGAPGVAASPSARASSAKAPVAAEPAPVALTPQSTELSPKVLVMAAERAPFDPERQAPVGRYLFPEERVTPAPPREPEPPPTPPFRVVGAIAGIPGATPGAAGGIAVVQADGQQPKMLNVGEVFMDFRISSVEKDAVVVSNRGWDMSLPVEQLQATRIASGSGARNNARNANQANAAAREAERAINQMRETIQGLQQQFQGNVQIDGQGNGQFRFQMQDGRAVIQGPNGQRTEIAIPGGPAGNGEVPIEIQKIIVAPGGRVSRPPGGGQ